MTRVAIVGAGPVGLFLACLLADAGFGVTVLEAQRLRREDSRSIGVHPPALEALATVGVADRLVAAGVSISRTRVFDDGTALRPLSLAECPPPFPFVLALPQGATEAVLEERLEELAPGSLRRGGRVKGVRFAPRPVLEVDDGPDEEADFVIGCDGRSSCVRRSVGVDFRGAAHPHHYLMADVSGDGQLGGDAALYLGPKGVVESFPLPDCRRRWVARVEVRPERPTGARLAQIVYSRTGMRITPADEQVSAFTAETRVATAFTGPGWALAGDACHVVSPIGGQGMNLGLLGAFELSRALTRGTAAALEGYGRIQRRRFRRAARRARLNMTLGSTGVAPCVRSVGLRTLLAAPLERPVARFFTMRGL